jgi:hypothetical protein
VVSLLHLERVVVKCSSTNWLEKTRNFYGESRIYGSKKLSHVHWVFGIVELSVAAWDQKFN